MNPLRRSYEARVLVVPLGTDAIAHVSGLTELGVTGVHVLTRPDTRDAHSIPLGDPTWQPPTPASTREVAESADMVVLLATNLSAVDQRVVHDVCAAARDGGDLVAAVLVNPTHWEEPDGASAMVTLRQEVDMLISIRKLSMLAALLDVLRGGPRDRVAVAGVPA